MSYNVQGIKTVIQPPYQDAPVKEDLVPDLADSWSLNNYELLLNECSKDIVEDDSKRGTIISILNFVIETLKAAKRTLTKDILHGDLHGLNLIVNTSYCPAVRSRHNTIKTINCDSQTEDEDSNDTNVDEKSKINNMTLDDLVLMTEKLKYSQESLISNTDVLSVYGIIDFNDMCYSFTVFEIGRLIADMMVTYLVESKKHCELLKKKRTVMDFPESSKDHLLKIGGYVFAGYLSVKTLIKTDIDCVYPAMLTSLCQYYILGAKAALEKPESKDYVSYCADEASMLLDLFHAMDQQDVSRIWTSTALKELEISISNQ